MPIFNKLLHSKIRNKLGIKISQTLINKSKSAKEIKYKKYIPIKNIKAKKNKTILLAKSMKKENIDIETIKRITGLSIDEIKKL